MSNYTKIIFLFLFIPSALPIDFTEQNRRIILQSDVETVVIHTKLRAVSNRLAILLEQANQIRQESILDHVRNNLGIGEGRVNKLVSASILASINQIEIIQRDFNSFFEQHAEIVSRKRALEILGSFLSKITGVPSARDHRLVLEKVRLLKLDNEEMGMMLKRQNEENKDILATFHFQENVIGNLSEDVTRIYSQTKSNRDNIERLSATISMTNKINSALEEARISIAHMKEIMNDNKLGHLSKFTISPSQLSNIIDQIYLKRRKNTPIFAGRDCHLYYNQPLAHSWVNQQNLQITTLLQIPIAPMHQIYNLEVLNDFNQIHSDLPLAVVNRDMNIFRYLSLSDYNNCLKADGSIICQKREITIMPKVGCSLKRNNCDEWTDIVVHDITNSQILIILQNETRATLKCDEKKPEFATLPKRAVLNLDVHCQLETDSFLVSKLSYRHLRDLEYEEESSVINLELEHSALHVDKTADLAISNIMKGHSGNITELIKRNELIRKQIDAEKIASNRRWAQASGGMYPWEQIVLWCMIAGLSVGLLTSLTWLFKLQRAAKHRKKEARRNARELEENQREKMRDMTAQVDDMVTDARIKVRAITHETEAEEEDDYMSID